MTPNGPIPLPDHGISGDARFVGGAFYDYDPKYFRNTILQDFRSPDYGKFNVIRDVAPKVKEDRKSTRLNSSHIQKSRMPSSA